MNNYKILLSENKKEKLPFVVIYGSNIDSLKNEINQIRMNFDCIIMCIESAHDDLLDYHIFEELHKEKGKYNVNFEQWYFISYGQTSKNAFNFLSKCPRSFSGYIFHISDLEFDFQTLNYIKDIPIKFFSEKEEILDNLNILVNKLGYNKSEFLIGNNIHNVLSNLKNIEWLFNLKKTNQITYKYLKNGLWKFQSGLIDSFYLLETKEKAFVIDTGMTTTPIIPVIRQITQLPLELIITHGHIDHIALANEFSKIYFPKKDIDLFYKTNETLPKNLKIDSSKFEFIDDGDEIQIDENHNLEIIKSYGHTSGSISIVDHKNKFIFSGDSFGSGTVVLLNFDYSLTINQYKETLLNFLKHFKNDRNYLFFGGHEIQETDWEYLNQNYHPIKFSVLDDMITLCNKVLNNEIDYIPFPTCDQKNEKAYGVYYKSAGIVLVKSKVC